MDEYIRRRKVQERAKEMLRYYVLNKVIQNFRDNFRVLKKKKNAKQMGRFLSFVIAMH